VKFLAQEREERNLLEIPPIRTTNELSACFVCVILVTLQNCARQRSSIKRVFMNIPSFFAIDGFIIRDQFGIGS
jgi:hypothetical protein